MITTGFTSKHVVGVILVFAFVLGCIGVGLAVGSGYWGKGTEGVRRYDFKIKRDVQVVDGRTLTVNTVNGAVLGPAIRVRRGEMLSVRVTNELPDHGVSLHWHGFVMKGVQHFDGVVGLTQCAIAPGESFLYEFVVDEIPGTYWWHGHSDMIPAGHDFLRGALIVHDPEDTIVSDVVASQSYQIGNETVLLFMDLYPNYMGYDQPQTMGGLNRGAAPDLEGFGSGAIGWTSGVLNGEAQHVVEVQNGEHRFRIINGGGLFPYFFSIDGYKLTVVATDGAPVEPYEADVVQVHTGERYDVLVNLRITAPTHNVWIRAMTPSAKQDMGIMGILRIRMDETVEYSEELPQTQLIDMKNARILNCAMFEMPEYDCNPVTDLKSVIEREVFVETESHVADFLFQFVPQYAHLWSINHDTWKQNVLPLKAMIMDSFDSAQDLHPHAMVLSLPLNKTVTFVIRSVTAFPHPMHLHGHKFEVLEVATRLRKECPDARCDLPDLNRLFPTSVEELSKRLRQGVLKDTVIVPAGGAVALRFNTDNPGMWFLHCHLDQHMEDGQGFMVDEGGYSQSVFPSDYPSCNYTGRIQHLETAECQCYEDMSLDERWRMKSTYRCSRPHLCKHVL